MGTFAHNAGSDSDEGVVPRWVGMGPHPAQSAPSGLVIGLRRHRGPLQHDVFGRVDAVQLDDGLHGDLGVLHDPVVGGCHDVDHHGATDEFLVVDQHAFGEEGRFARNAQVVHRDGALVPLDALERRGIGGSRAVPHQQHLTGFQCIGPYPVLARDRPEGVLHRDAPNAAPAHMQLQHRIPRTLVQCRHGVFARSVVLDRPGPDRIAHSEGLDGAGTLRRRHDGAGDEAGGLVELAGAAGHARGERPQEQMGGEWTMRHAAPLDCGRPERGRLQGTQCAGGLTKRPVPIDATLPQGGWAQPKGRWEPARMGRLDCAQTGRLDHLFPLPLLLSAPPPPGPQMTPRQALAVTVLFVGLVPATVHSARKDKKAPKAQGMRMPDLSVVLGTDWEVPPELSDRAQPGTVLEVTASGYRRVLEDCVGSAPKESSLANIDLSNSLSGGVAWGAGARGASAGGATSMRLNFQGPTVVGFDLIDFVPSAACVSRLTAYAERGGDVSQLVLVQEALMARVSGCEKTEVSAGVALPGGRGEVAVAGACQMFSDVPVAVGVRSVPFAEVRELAGLGATSSSATPPPSAPPAAPTPPPSRGTEKPCTQPFDSTVFDYLDISTGWQHPMEICRGDSVTITPTKKDKYRLEAGGPWVTAAGNPSRPTVGVAGMPCHQAGCLHGMLVARFVADTGQVVIIPVTGGQATFTAPSHGTLDYAINDDVLSDNQWYAAGGITDHTALEISPAR